MRSPARMAGSLVALAGLGTACVLVVTACGSSSPSTSSSGSTTTAAASTTPSSTTSAGAGAASFTAYRSCLQGHGYTLPVGGGFSRRGGATGASGATGATGAAGAFGATGASGASGPGGFARPALTPAEQRAVTACASLRPTGGFGGGFGGGGFASSNPAFAKFEACLKSHGVQTGPGASRASAAFQTALAACRSLLPAGAFGGGGFAGRGATGGGGANASTFARYQACLKAHGIQPGAAGQSAAKLQTAISACRSVLSSGATGASGSSTPASTTTG